MCGSFGLNHVLSVWALSCQTSISKKIFQPVFFLQNDVRLSKPVFFWRQNHQTRTKHHLETKPFFVSMQCRLVCQSQIEIEVRTIKKVISLWLGNKIIRQEHHSISKRSHFFVTMRQSQIEIEVRTIKKVTSLSFENKIIRQDHHSISKRPFLFSFHHANAMSTLLFSSQIEIEVRTFTSNCFTVSQQFFPCLQNHLYFQRGQQRRNYFRAKLKWSESPPPPHARAAL